MMPAGGTLDVLDGGWWPYYRSSLLNLYGSQAFITRKGYVGLCQDTVGGDDRVFIPSGSHCLYVIRKASIGGTDPSPGSPSATTERRTLLGEAYIHGIMDGELDLGKKTVAHERFYLV